MSLWDAAPEALQALMDRLQCSRVSLWKFDLDDGTRALRCFASKRTGEVLLADTTTLSEDQYHNYFAALIQTGVFVANDVLSERRLTLTRRIFLKQHGIGALLDVAVTINGRAYGIVCCEQIPGPREWRPEDIASARIAVSRAALLIAADPSVELDALHSVAIERFVERRIQTLHYLGHDRRAARRPEVRR